MTRMIRLVVPMLVVALVFSAAPAFGYVFFSGASFGDASTGYLSGRYSQTMGFVSTTKDGGATWSTKSFAGRPLGGVYAWSPTRAMLSPVAGSLLWMTDTAGSSWIPSVPSGDADFSLLTGMAAFSPDVRIAAGQRYGVAGGTEGLISVSTNGGSTWAPRWSGPEYFNSDGSRAIAWAGLVGVDTVASGTHGWAVGNETNSQGTGSTYKRGLILKTADSGTTWTLQTAPAGTFATQLSCVTAVSQDVAYIGRTDGSVLKTTDGGANWTPVAPAFAGAQRVAVTALESRGASRLLAAGPQGRVAWSTNGGTSWQTAQMANGKNLKTAAFASDSAWMVAGDGFSAYRTTNGGGSWSAVKVHKKPTVTSPYASAPIYKNKTRSWYGYISPRHPITKAPGGTTVKLSFQRKSSGKYKAYKTTYASVSDYKSENRSRYASSVKLTSTGSYRVKATYVSEWGGTITSSYRYFSVK